MVDSHLHVLILLGRPDPGMLDPQDFIAPRNSYAMPLLDFIPHLTRVLEQLGLSFHARSSFITYVFPFFPPRHALYPRASTGVTQTNSARPARSNLSAFVAHKNLAYRFLNPSKIANAIDISVATPDVVFTRLFFMFRGVDDDEMANFETRGEKEANTANWREQIRWSEVSKDPTQFRILEVSVMELS